ncbi:MAG: AAA family ATPase [Pseudomonadota bacterium]
MSDLTTRLRRAGYLCDDRFAAAVQVALATKPAAGAFLSGPIGAGKSFLPEVLARVIDADFFFYQCFPGTREEDLLVKMLPSEDSVSGVALFDGVIIQAVRATQAEGAGRRVILTLDEWDKTRPSADSFLLDFLQTGRVNFSGRVFQADLSRLVVFLTFNMEREMSEPLLRRLPKIDFPAPTPSLVYQALRLTHPDHPYVYNAVILYERCLAAELPKPATIQELRQLLDAVALLGDEADWDDLVYQLVTKSEENHELLRRAEQGKSRWKNKFRNRLDPAAYEIGLRPFPRDEASGRGRSMPRLAEARSFDENFETPGDPPDPASSGGLIELTKSAYNELVRLVDGPTDSPDRLGDIARVHGRVISLERPWPLSRVNELEGLWGENGEVLLVEDAATWEDVKALPTWAHIDIVKFSQREILAKSDGVDLRWTPEQGAEIIVDLAKRHVFQHVFGESWGRAGEAKWIGRGGSIFQRRLDRDQKDG